MKIAAVTTCMGRLEHLQATLPHMLSQFDEVIVVDWSCPQNSGKWAEKEGATVVFRPGNRYFNVSKARNIGARQIKSRSVCFIDADTMALPGLREEIEERLSLSTMIISSRMDNGYDCQSLNGFLAIDIGHFWGVGGYNESLEGYSLEDAHIRARLRLERGLEPRRVSSLAGLRHCNSLRDRFYKEPIHVSSKRGYNELQVYLQSKGIKDWITDSRTAEIAYRMSP